MLVHCKMYSDTKYCVAQRSSDNIHSKPMYLNKRRRQVEYYVLNMCVHLSAADISPVILTWQCLDWNHLPIWRRVGHCRYYSRVYVVVEELCICSFTSLRENIALYLLEFIYTYLHCFNDILRLRILHNIYIIYIII